MYSHATLWVDKDGRLCESPPASGLKIAAVKGDEIPREFVDSYGLSEVGGKVVQKNAPNKAVKAPPEKIHGGLTIMHETGTRSSEVVPAADKPADEPKKTGKKKKGSN